MDYGTPPPAQTIGPLIGVGVGLLVLMLRHRKPRPLRLQWMWVAPVLFTVLIGVGLYAIPHDPFGPVAYASLVLAFALGCVAGWWRGKGIRVERDARTGELMAQASPFGLLLIVAILMVRLGLKDLLDKHAAEWGLNVGAVTDGFLLFALGLIVAQRVELFIRARKVPPMGVAA